MKVKMTNTVNGKSALCEVNVPAYSACYAAHGDLMAWAKKTGCARLLKRVWDGDDIEPFIEVEMETVCGFAVYRNEKCVEGRFSWYKNYVGNADKLAFWAEEAA